MVEAYTAKQQQHPASKRYELIADDNEDDGVSEEQRTARRHSKRRCTSSSSRSSAGSSSSSGGSSRSRSVGGEEDDEDAAFAARVRAANAAAKAARGNLDDAAWEWQQRLQEEAAWDSGDGAFGAGGLAAADLRAASSVEEGEFWPGERAEEEVDLWADRIWQGMQARRRQQAAESSRAFGAAMRRDAERAAAEAAARSRSEKILQDEQAKDAAWRQRVVGLLPAPQAVVDVGRQREVYEAKWAALDALLMPPPPPPSAAAARRTLTTADLPWPPVLASATGAEVSTISRQAAIGPALPGSAGVREQLQQPELGTPAALDAYRTVVLLGVQGAADIKKRLRSEILRWHPDKWVAKYGALLPAASAGGTAAALLRDRLLAHVRGMSQMVTQLMSAPAV